jgi:hypothetical protein
MEERGAGDKVRAAELFDDKRVIISALVANNCRRVNKSNWGGRNIIILKGYKSRV